MAHTPGPWTKRMRSDGDYSIKSDNDSGLVAKVSQTAGNEYHVNADLVAAAPEMFQALTYAVHVIAELRRHVKLTTLINSAELAASLVVIDEAIDKARGFE